MVFLPCTSATQTIKTAVLFVVTAVTDSFVYGVQPSIHCVQLKAVVTVINSNYVLT